MVALYEETFAEHYWNQVLKYVFCNELDLRNFVANSALSQLPGVIIKLIWNSMIYQVVPPSFSEECEDAARDKQDYSNTTT